MTAADRLSTKFAKGSESESDHAGRRKKGLAICKHPQANEMAGVAN